MEQIHGYQWIRTLRPVQTERVIRSRISQFNTCVKHAQIENSLSYFINTCDLRKSEQAISDYFKSMYHNSCDTPGFDPKGQQKSSLLKNKKREGSNRAKDQSSERSKRRKDQKGG